ncbi:hypothetical protein F4820DRAFT_421841 [Hypoxylon rubiginosum]|uniref:Uncharacterized protein n=1 Tax=Hypoxylon rubiginosum TaxID=110542 RepID=A0ACB9YZY6_9PEZI|nr:hypothetical protein F4820DRAFT_421841 [Hypoxylon rubiginosum]
MLYISRWILSLSLLLFLVLTWELLLRVRKRLHTYIPPRISYFFLFLPLSTYTPYATT